MAKIGVEYALRNKKSVIGGILSVNGRECEITGNMEYKEW